MHNKKGNSKYGDKKGGSNGAKEKGSNDNKNDGKHNKSDENLNNVVSTSERRILFYKTKICPWYIKGKCERRKTCLYAHAQNELRELPNLCKTSLCPKLKINEACNDKKCKYAHTNIELRATENLYKTALCESYSKGKCFSGQFCRYAHGLNELRENPMEITDKNIIIGTCKTKNENINNNKSEYDKKKGGTDSSSTGDNSKRNETYCVFPKKKERNSGSNKYNNVLTEDDGADSADHHAVNDTNSGEHNHEYKNKSTKQNTKNGNKNSQNNNKMGDNSNGNETIVGNNNGNNNKRMNKKMTKQANKAMNKQIENGIENQVNKQNEEISEYRNKHYNGKNIKYDNSNSNHKNGHNNVNNMVGGALPNYLKHEDNSKFNEEQFLNDNLNVLSFLEDNSSSIEKFRKNYSSGISNEVVVNGRVEMVDENYNNNKGGLDNKNILICDKESKNNNLTGSINYIKNVNNPIINSVSNNNIANYPSPLLKFNIPNLVEGDEINNLALHPNINNEIDNIRNMNYYKYPGMNNIVNYSNYEFENNNNRVMDNENGSISMGMPEHVLNKNIRNGESEHNFYINNRREMDIEMHQRNNIMSNVNYICDNNLVWNGNNDKYEHWGNEQPNEKFEGWENYAGFEKEKPFNSEQDYFKIFNYGMCNNVSNKFNNCDPHKNQIDKYDNSLFIL
ncbi:zinc finger protein, putative [Plasmodium vinckei vinckei]|uniref:Zinc finger protein, putative n=1 Tax=Plasmodium vinckei vinckei TaxID=54757 RepID=A0A081IBF1_PLAVN|nr:zinc finger protein, putative [Plasmodium vinckei vinckei]KEG01009.1 hypothetical protein YYE_04042 [Plasmodium vinckei vinckei]VEV55060.1 zinc finger protein, putative [Plasmodium vinckei vinckei]